ncbi:hypothetical protein F0L74_00160 [Chitinophaga agrisoli]|uniref:Uncharacterized protein n=1 Tax=Chitinophaga agrisoli TaxID=2607653 RepID=A0A5B2W1R2_9BACT|nr:hypothetical protein [Chitinophaga agrisoli]KAA2244436.1 hypothetical protein F0L74_00160 [Chitinophaga agrisoli]
MAKQAGPVFITGTHNGISFYKMDGEYYARRKSSLSGKRVKKDPAFTLTMVYAGILGQASAIAAAVYRTLPPERKQHRLYRAMTGTANRLLKQGMELAAVKAQLMEECGLAAPTTKQVQAASCQIPRATKRAGNKPPKTLRIMNSRLMIHPLQQRGKLVYTQACCGTGALNNSANRRYELRRASGS